ncbi:DUF5681 domain-containing protein [Rickettsiales bacterium]|nr:DUF5681 domain-containing protein [Rickettsiales bacterium]
MPKKTKKSDKITDDSILEQLLKELDKTIDAKEGNVSSKITKGEALIKSMVNEALKGDQRMMTNVLKFIEKLDALKSAKKETEEKKEEKLSETDEDIILRYYGRHKESIEKELEKRYRKDPNSWYFYKKYVKNTSTTT